MRHSIDFGFPHKLQAITVQRLDQGIHRWRPSLRQKDYAEHRTLNIIDTKINRNEREDEDCALHTTSNHLPCGEGLLRSSDPQSEIFCFPLARQ